MRNAQVVSRKQINKRHHLFSGDLDLPPASKAPLQDLETRRFLADALVVDEIIPDQADVAEVVDQYVALTDLGSAARIGDI